MTKLHKVLFVLWKLKMWFLGVRKGRLLKIYSEEKEKFVLSAVTGFAGCSVTRTKYDFSVKVQFFEPIKGDDARFFSRSYVTQDEFFNQFKFA